MFFFPHPDCADENGLVAVGGDFSPSLMVHAYSRGIFPWPIPEADFIPWFSPRSRAVIDISRSSVSRSIQRSVRSSAYSITANTCFEKVVALCATCDDRSDPNSTWITEDLKKGYLNLYNLGLAYSIEAWSEGMLVGGLFGITIGGFVNGESMFSLESGGSKACLFHAIEVCKKCAIPYFDVQVMSEHLRLFGAKEIPQKKFLDFMDRSLTIAPSFIKNL